MKESIVQYEKNTEKRLPVWNILDFDSRNVTVESTLGLRKY